MSLARVRISEFSIFAFISSPFDLNSLMPCMINVKASPSQPSPLFVIFPFTLAFTATACESVCCVEWVGERKNVKPSCITPCRIVIYQ